MTLKYKDLMTGTESTGWGANVLATTQKTRSHLQNIWITLFQGIVHFVKHSSSSGALSGCSYKTVSSLG
jgi:hypothetical protein